MAFWSNLAKYGLMAAPYVAAPFTGGSSLALAGIGAGVGAGGALLNGGDATDALIAGGMGAIPGATAGINRGASAAIQAGASGGLSALQPGGLGTMPGTPYDVTPPPPQTAQGGFWSKIANQAKEGLGHRDTYTTAARAIAGAIAASRANQPSMGDVQRLEYIAGGGREGGSLGLTGPTSERERKEARKRLHGPGFWSKFLDYGVAPGLAIYGSTIPQDTPQGRP